jgi:hypothetical protein
MFNIKKKASNAKIRKKYMAQTEQSWLICDGWKCSKAAKLLVSIDTVQVPWTLLDKLVSSSGR